MAIRSLVVAVLLALGIAACSPGLTPPDAVEGGVNIHHVTMSDFAFSPSEVTVVAGEPFVLRLTNEGTVLHDLDHTFVEPGQTGDMPVTLAAGTYEMICTIPGHLQAGMSLRVTAR